MSKQSPREHIVLTASGDDRVGLVDKLTSRIAEIGCNIEESRMAVLGGQFALIMLLTGRWDAVSRLENQLPDLGEQLGLAIIHKRTRERAQDKPMLPYYIEVVSMDHPGIVHSVASFFARRGVNIEQLDTDSYPAPHSGTPMFTVRMTVGIPADTHVPSLRGDFFEHCDDLNLDATFEPSR